MPRGRKFEGTIEDYLRQNTEKLGRDDCWPWKLSTNGDGYGRINIAGPWDKMTPHRALWILRNGPLLPGWEVDHLCRNRSCQNPKHHEAVPKAVNTLRGFSPQAINARKTHCPRGHELTPENTPAHRLRDGTRKCKICDNRKTSEQKKRKNELRREKYWIRKLAHDWHELTFGF